MLAVVLALCATSAFSVTLQRHSQEPYEEYCDDPSVKQCSCPHEEVMEWEEDTLLYVGKTWLGAEEEPSRTLFGTGSDLVKTGPFKRSVDYSTENLEERVEYYTFDVHTTIGKDKFRIGHCEVYSEVYESDVVSDNTRIVGLGPIPNQTVHPFLEGNVPRLSFCVPARQDASLPAVMTFGAVDPETLRRPVQKEADTEDEDESLCGRTPGCSWLQQILKSIIDAIWRCWCNVFGGDACDADTSSKPPETEMTAVPTIELPLHGHHGAGAAADHWMVKVSGVALVLPNGSEILIAEEVRTKSEPEVVGNTTKFWEALFDTATGFMQAPPEVVDQLKKQVVESIDFTDDHECASESSPLPDLVFRFDKGPESAPASFTFKPNQYLRRTTVVGVPCTGSPASCPCKLQIVSSEESGFYGVFVMGLPAMVGKTLYFDYNVDNRKITIVDNTDIIEGPGCPTKQEMPTKDTAVTEKKKHPKK